MGQQKERLKSGNRRELHPKCNNGDNCIVEHRHIGCNSVEKLREKRLLFIIINLDWDVARGLVFHNY